MQFVVSLLLVQGEWAFVIATPQTKTGQPIDYARTHYAQAIADGVFDGGTVFALLQWPPQGRSGSAPRKRDPMMHGGRLMHDSEEIVTVAACAPACVMP